MNEPIIHSFNTDCLPEEHPWVRKTVSCGRCGEMVHAFNNECMQVWVELEQRALCIDCFKLLDCPVTPSAFQDCASAFTCIDSGE